MKILVFSDTHKETEMLLKKLREYNDYDLAVHLGDVYKDVPVLEEQLGQKIIWVKGNCDIGRTDEEIEKVLELKGKKVLITHGDIYDVKNTMDRILQRAKELQVDAVFYGHTHESQNEVIDGIYFFNPGSTSNRLNNPVKKFGIVNIEDEISGEIIIVGKTLEFSEGKKFGGKEKN